MGRELKRVPTNFAWPLGQIWSGFINPYRDLSGSCLACDGTGYSKMAKLFHEQWYGNAPFDPVAYGAEPLKLDSPVLRQSVERKVEIEESLARQDGRRSWYTRSGISRAEAIDREIERMFEIQKGQWCHHLIQADVDALVTHGRLSDFTSVWSRETGWRIRPEISEVCPNCVYLPDEQADDCERCDGMRRIIIKPPTAKEVNDWSFFGMGHDSSNCWICVKARCDREGHEEVCPSCGGEGCIWPSTEAKALYENWEPTQPPTGDAYQIWETVSDGSPVSPACETPEELARWMVENDDSVTQDTTYEGWLAFIRGPGWAPSMVMSERGMQSGVAAMVEFSEDVRTDQEARG